MANWLDLSRLCSIIIRMQTPPSNGPLRLTLTLSLSKMLLYQNQYLLCLSSVNLSLWSVMLQAWHWCGTDARRKVIGIFQQGLVRSRSYQLCLRRVVDGPSPCYSTLEICLLGRCFLVRTDYRSLRHLLHQKLLHLHNNFGWPNFWVMISWSNTKLGLLILLLTHYLDRRRMVPSWPYLVCLV